jgi:hypothetical protein
MIISDTEIMQRAQLSLRNLLRDKRELNRLLGGQYETSPEELQQCLISALIDWNMTPPLIGQTTLRNHPNKFLLLQKAAIEALTSAGVWHSREHLPSSDGGTSGDDHAKAGEYSGWVERWAADYERKKSDLKTSLNISMALNDMGMPSEYGLLQNYYYGALW